MKANISNQLNAITASWAPPQQFYQAGSQLDVGPDGKPLAATTPDATKSRSAAIRAGANIGKAGDILFAVLSTAVNSDEPGPVMAQIVGGKFKGAKLIGRISRPTNAKRVIITFNTLSIANRDHTISINAVAIDPDTARIALSSKTDSHYLVRYGSLFASSFLEGLGSAFKTQGSKITVNGGGVAGTTIAEQASRTFGENTIIGLEKVGQRWGTKVAPIFNMPPTVQVYAGTSLGILFNSDVAIPPPSPALEK